MKKVLVVEDDFNNDLINQLVKSLPVTVAEAPKTGQEKRRERRKKKRK